jgi:hypothetical protein
VAIRFPLRLREPHHEVDVDRRCDLEKLAVPSLDLLCRRRSKSVMQPQPFLWFPDGKRLLRPVELTGQLIGTLDDSVGQVEKVVEVRFSGCSNLFAGQHHVSPSGVIRRRLRAVRWMG